MLMPSISLLRKEYTDAFRIRVFCFAFFIFYQLFFCLLVLLSFWESSIALKSYRFLCQKDKSEKNDKQEKFGVSLIQNLVIFWPRITDYTSVIVLCQVKQVLQDFEKSRELKTIKMNFFIGFRFSSEQNQSLNHRCLNRRF